MARDLTPPQPPLSPELDALLSQANSAVNTGGLWGPVHEDNEGRHQNPDGIALDAANLLFAAIVDHGSWRNYQGSKIAGGAEM